MTQNQPAPGSSLESAPGGDAEPLGHLYKMSPTAGVATTDYAAINTTAIVAMLLGVASVLTLFNPVFLVIPLVGTICGIIAVRQIRGSNGTQVGALLAWGGLLLSVGLGGTVFARQAATAIRHHGDEREIAGLMEQLGRDIHEGNLDAAYSLFGSRFHQRVTPELFAERIKELESVTQWGGVASIGWNQQPMVFEVNADSGVESAAAMTLDQMEKVSDPIRELMTFVRERNGWKLNDIPRLFPTEKPRSGAPGGASGQ